MKCGINYKDVVEQIKKDYPEFGKVDELEDVLDTVKNLSYTELIDQYYSTKIDLVNKLNWAKPRFKDAPIVINNVEKDLAKNGFAVSFKYKNGKKTFTTYTDEYGTTYDGHNLTFSKDISFEASTRGFNELFSSYEDANLNTASMMYKAVDNVNDPEQMISLAEKLASTGNVSEEYKASMLDVIRNVVDPLKKYIPEMSLWLDEEAKKNGGKLVLSGDKMGIYIAASKDDATKSALEVFVHEVVHGATAYAINAKDAATATAVKRLQDIRTQLLAEAENNPKLLGEDGDVALNTLLYISNRDTGLHEFVAYAMSNPSVITALKSLEPLQKETEEYPNLFSKLVGTVRKILDRVMLTVRKERKDIDGHTLAVKLIQELIEANNKALYRTQEQGKMGLVRLLTGVEESFKDLRSRMEAKIRAKPFTTLPSNATTASKLKYAAKVVALASVDERYAQTLELAVDTASKTPGLGWLAPHNNFRSSLKAMLDGDVTSDVVGRMAFLGKGIQQHKQDLLYSTMHTLQNGFKQKLTPKEEVLLTSMLLDTDAQEALIGKSSEEIIELLEQPETLQAEIDTLSDTLKQLVSPEAYRYMNASAKGLGVYLATDKAYIGQPLNAWNIARLVGTSKETLTPSNTEAVDIIDELASLYAIQAKSGNERKKLAALIKREPEGVEQLLAYAASLASKSKEGLFQQLGDEMRYMKGYTKQIYDKFSSIEIAPVTEEKNLSAQGFTKEVELKKHPDDPNKGTMAIYKSRIKAEQNLNTVTLMYGSKQGRGTTFREIGYMQRGAAKIQQSINLLKAKVEEEAERIMRTGVLPPVTEDTTILPVYNSIGKITDFRYVASKETKETYLGLDRRAIPVLANGFSMVYEKSTVPQFNEEVMKIIEEDAKAHYNPRLGTLGTNVKQYVMVSRDSSNKEAKHFWKILPDYIKSKHPNGFPVRQDLLYYYMGKPDYSITSTAMVQAMPVAVRSAIKIAEQIWKDLVQITKVDWVIKTPIVAIQNIVTNIMLSATVDGSFGANIVRIARMQLKAVEELNRYLKVKKELTYLEGRRDAKLATAQEISKIERLLNDLKDSSIDKMIKEGFYSTVIEDLAFNDYSQNESMTTAAINKQMNKLPPLVRNGLEWLYFGSSTPMFKFMQAVTSYSDFAARYAHYNLKMEQQGKYEEILARKEAKLNREYAAAADDKKEAIAVELKELSAEKAMDYEEKVLKEVRDSFVNYNLPVGYEYLNQMGLLMFSKWFVSIQRAIRQLWKGHPLKALISLVGQEMILGVNVETIEDNSLPGRVWNDDSWSKVFGLQLRDPFDHLWKLLVPATYELGSSAAR